jgi:hypothetical protein
LGITSGPDGNVWFTELLGNKFGRFLLASENRPPLANAGTNQTMECQGAATSVTLDGTGSSDPEGDALTYAWSEGGTSLGSGATLTRGFALGTHLVVLTVTDPAGLSGSANVTVTVVDTLPPVIAITSPSAAVYTLGESVSASYTAADGGSGVATLVGTVPSGASIDTASVGTKTLNVLAADNAGNLAAKSVAYSVGYGVRALYDQTKAVKSGATVPIKVSLCDAGGGNVSTSAITLHAVGVVLASTSAPGALDDAGNANPDSDFRFDPTLGVGGGYIFNLKTTGLVTGTYRLRFTAGNDPIIHVVEFQVK